MKKKWWHNKIKKSLAKDKTKSCYWLHISVWPGSFDTENMPLIFQRCSISLFKNMHALAFFILSVTTAIIWRHWALTWELPADSTQSEAERSSDNSSSAASAAVKSSAQTDPRYTLSQWNTNTNTCLELWFPKRKYQNKVWPLLLGSVFHSNWGSVIHTSSLQPAHRQSLKFLLSWILICHWHQSCC